VEVEEPTLPGPRIVVSLEVEGTPTGAEVVVLVVVELLDGGTFRLLLVDELPAAPEPEGLIVVVDDGPPLSDGFWVVVVVVDCWASAGTARIRPIAVVAESRAFRIQSSVRIIPERDRTGGRREGS
jgi:hypothetical protein